ncbi:MAG: threonine synthase [marine benthic group bacterium]|nr:threonine synthase [Gemmatimonadota bacterium]
MAIEADPGFRLECGVCGASSDAAPLASLCTICGGPQLVRYPEVAELGPDVAARWADRPRGMWRFREILPLRQGEVPISLGEGDTPLLPLLRLGEDLGLRLLMKDEGRNPTGSFKDRGLAAALTRAVHDGAREFVIPSAGNAGAALAAYAARAGVPARIFLPEDTPPGVQVRCRAFGAEVTAVDGLITDCGALAAEDASRTGAFDLSTLREPYRIEGKKTMALEILEALEWQPPDAVVYPTGGGTGLIGTWKALDELAAIGLITSPETRLYAVQGEGCAPIVRAWLSGQQVAEPWQDAHTEAWGLRVPRARGDRLILRAIRDTDGGAIAVSDDRMQQETLRLQRTEGINACIEGGAVLAAARALRAAGQIREGETVVLFNTGNLQNY